MTPKIEVRESVVVKNSERVWFSDLSVVSTTSRPVSSDARRVTAQRLLDALEAAPLRPTLVLQGDFHEALAWSDTVEADEHTGQTLEELQRHLKSL